MIVLVLIIKYDNGTENVTDVIDPDLVEAFMQVRSRLEDINRSI